MANQWDRKKGESEAAFAAFKVFLDQGKVTVKSPEFCQLVKDRTGYEISPRTLSDYQTDHKWRERKRAYQSWILNKKGSGIAESLAKEAVLAASGHAKIRRIVRTRTIRAIQETPQFTDESDARTCNAYMDWLAKALNLGLQTDLDHADQLRRVSATIGGTGPDGDSEAEEILPPIPLEPGPVQLGDSAAEAVLEPPA